MLYVDPPTWPARGRLWSHLVSDVSYAELHAFAEMLGAPRRGFERDHYDIPSERFPMAVLLGARVVPGREIVARLTAAGLRRPKHSTATPAGDTSSAIPAGGTFDARQGRGRSGGTRIPAVPG